MKLQCALSEDVRAAMAVPAATYDDLGALVVPGVTPRWHVATVFAGSERKVERELVSRRFGIYIPETEREVWCRRRRLRRVELMFPGYVFVFLWDAVAHLSRIESVPGVFGLLHVDGQPVTLKDSEIDIIREVENRMRPLPFPTRRCRRKRTRVDDEIVSVRAWSAFEDDLMSLDSAGRNQSLMRALGLCL